MDAIRQNNKTDVRLTLAQTTHRRGKTPTKKVHKGPVLKFLSLGIRL